MIIKQRNRKIIIEITLIRIKINNYKEKISLNIIKIGTY